MKVGFIGLGIMGKPMAKHLIQNGFTTCLFDLKKEATDELAEIGGIVCESLYDVAIRSDVVITMLPKDEHVSQVLFSHDGIANNAYPNTIVIDMSSVSIEKSKEFANKLKEYHINFIDAPVSGGEPMAIEGKLSIMAGGSKEHYNLVLPLLKAMGHTVSLMGDNGTGTAAKLANQIIVSTNLAAMSEALVFASKSGININSFYEVVHGGLAGSTVLDAKISKIINRDFNPGGRIETNTKDLYNIQKSSDNIGAPTPITNLVKEFFKSEIANGHAEKDHSFIIDFFERLADYQIPKGG